MNRQASEADHEQGLSRPHPGHLGLYAGAARLAARGDEGLRRPGAAAGAEAALDRKSKEFIALAIGITQRCDGCIGFHAKALAELGASRQEIAEVAAMSVYMGGGPALMYAADALRAFDQFSAAA
ncbi:hypothetical protein BMIN10S_03681 [Bosea minatitlanensis]